MSFGGMIWLSTAGSWNDLVVDSRQVVISGCRQQAGGNIWLSTAGRWNDLVVDSRQVV